jgi:hypothetical protein
MSFFTLLVLTYEPQGQQQPPGVPRHRCTCLPSRSGRVSPPAATSDNKKLKSGIRLPITRAPPFVPLVSRVVKLDDDRSSRGWCAACAGSVYGCGFLIVRSGGFVRRLYAPHSPRPGWEVSSCGLFIYGEQAVPFNRREYFCNPTAAYTPLTPAHLYCGPPPSAASPLPTPQGI